MVNHDGSKFFILSLLLDVSVAYYVLELRSLPVPAGRPSLEIWHNLDV